jgi:hypothetical protein
MWAEPDVVTDLDADEARALTDQIKADAETLWDNIATAYTRRAWAALDYSSWDEYCIREFGSSRLRLPREERPEMVASLRQSGLSIRAIASATGIDKNTVQADLTQVSEIHTPDPVDEDALTEELIAAEPRAPVIGIDGKRYRPQRKPAPKPGRTPTQGSGCGTVSAFTVERRQPEPTPTQRRSDDNEIKFPVVLRSILRDLDALMGFAKALNPDAKRKVIDKHQVDLVDCAAKLVAINHELSEPEQEPATDQKPTDAS